MGIFHLEHVKVILGHSMHFSVNWSVLTQRWLIVEWNDENLGPRVYVHVV